MDEFHPTVQELIEAGYNLQQSIDAVEHSEELEGAFDYLMSIEGEGGIFQASTFVLDKKERLYRKEREVDIMEKSQQEGVLYVFWIILQYIGMSLSEPHTSIRSLWEVCPYVCPFICSHCCTSVIPYILG